MLQQDYDHLSQFDNRMICQLQIMLQPQSFTQLDVWHLGLQDSK